MSAATTITICPPWCSIKHDVVGAFHADRGHDVGGASLRVGARLFQADHPGAAPCIVVGGAGISPAQAVDLASYLSAAAEALTEGEATR